MADDMLQELFAERIGGQGFGKDTKIYKFERIKRAKAAARAENPDTELIDMGIGEPDESAPDGVVRTLAEEAGKWENRTYADNGIPEFYEAVAEYMQEVYGVSIDPESEVCHSIGSKNAMVFLPTAFINPGDASIMTIPGYPVLGTWTKYMGGELINLPLTAENGFLPDLDSLTPEQCKKAKLLYLNYPNNPTGACATPEFFDRVIAFAREHRILVVSDAAYAPLNFSGAPLSILSRPGAKDVAVELHSMSKGFNMTGWRLGWVCGNRKAVQAYGTVKDNADSGQFRAIQKASIWALKHHAEITPQICEKYQRRLQGLSSALNELGFNATTPAGSFYMYVAIPRGIRGGRSFENAEDFAEWLITEKLISTVPWDDAGSYIRFSATFPAKDQQDEQRVLETIKSRLSDTAFMF